MSDVLDALSYQKILQRIQENAEVEQERFTYLNDTTYAVARMHDG